jgi:hypothetical protein
MFTIFGVVSRGSGTIAPVAARNGKLLKQIKPPAIHAAYFLNAVRFNEIIYKYR